MPPEMILENVNLFKKEDRRRTRILNAIEKCPSPNICGAMIDDLINGTSKMQDFWDNDSNDHSFFDKKREPPPVKKNDKETNSLPIIISFISGVLFAVLVMFLSLKDIYH